MMSEIMNALWLREHVENLAGHQSYDRHRPRAGRWLDLLPKSSLRFSDKVLRFDPPTKQRRGETRAKFDYAGFAELYYVA